MGIYTVKTPEEQKLLLEFEALIQQWQQQEDLVMPLSRMWFRSFSHFLIQSTPIRTLLLKARYADNAPFCPDHRDKVAGKRCRECEIEWLNSQVLSPAPDPRSDGT